ncbi:MAG: efflux transporter outer membrane subunit [Bacteroidia bacterium]|nr:efflux transporter outer membrane subunit [Bacteroidia bacterium]
MSKHKINFLVAITMVLALGCKTTQYDTTAVNEKLPKKFDTNTDSASTTIAKWKDVFFDPHLVALIDTALKNNYDLRIALQKVEFAKAGLKYNKGIRLPELGINMAAGERKFGSYTMDGVGNYDTQFSPNINDKQQIPDPLPDYYVGFQTSWEIDLWGKLKNKKKASAARFISSQYGKDLIVTNLIAEIASAYFDLLALDNEAKILIDNIELQQEALDLVIAQKEAGRANELGIEMMTAQLLNSKAIQAEVQQLALETQSKLNFLCGIYPQSIKRDTSYFSQHLQTSLAAGIPSDLIKNIADIRQSEFELKASNADVRSAQAAFYPTLNINTALGLQSFNALLLLETPASMAYNAAGGLAAPLLNRRKLKADLMASKAEQKQAYINYEKTVVNSFKEVYIALNNIENTKKMYELKNEEVEILKRSIGTSSELFKAGKANYLEIISSQKNKLQAELELTNLHKRQNIGIIELYKAIGGGWR